MPYIEIHDYLTRGGTALGMDTSGLIKTQEQVMEEQQRAQMEAMLAQMAPGVTQEITKGMVNQNQQAGNEG